MYIDLYPRTLNIPWLSPLDGAEIACIEVRYLLSDYISNFR